MRKPIFAIKPIAFYVRMVYYKSVREVSGWDEFRWLIGL